MPKYNNPRQTWKYSNDFKVNAVLCTLRGLVAIPTLITSVNLDAWQLIASTVWFYVGICFIAGTIEYYSVVKSSV